jgi:probable F420-dependent oxidoreductase
MLIGAKLPLKADYPILPGIPEMARRLEDVGFDSIWCGDHTCMPAEITSHYPFSPDGTPHWDPTMPWYDVIVGLSIILTSTLRVRAGTAVLLLPLRNPMILAKQAAALQRVSGGRLELGVGVGWLKEEFDALGVDFHRRGAICDAAIDTIRQAWTGRMPPGRYATSDLRQEIAMEPTPGAAVPILVGGMSDAALARVARSGDGWLAVQNPRRFDEASLRRDLHVLRNRCDVVGREFDELRLVFSMSVSMGSSELCARYLPRLEELGFHEVLVDIDWESDRDEELVIERLRNASS